MSRADAEVLWLAWSGLAEVGVEGHRLRVGHVGVLHDLIRSYGLSEAAKLFIISNVQALKARGTDAASLVEQARAIGLLPGDDEAAIVTPAAVEGDAARGLLQQVLREVTSAPFGRRSTGAGGGALAPEGWRSRRARGVPCGRGTP